MKTRRLIILSLLVVPLLVGGGGLWVWQAKRQYALNRELIAALVTNDTKQALALVNRGADPNTRYNSPPAPTLKLLLNRVFHRSPDIAESSPTAFMLACRAFYKQPETAYDPQLRRKECPQLVQAMLTHGANTNEKDADGNTPVIKAAMTRNREAIDLLMAHGANINAQNRRGWTALQYVMDMDTDIRLVQQLLAYGADPKLANINGQNALTLAQSQERPDIVALLRKGAK